MIQPIVEGYGEVQAFPVLLRRLTAELGIPGYAIGRPIRGYRSDLVNEERLRARIGLAKRQPGCRAIIALFDADDDCPKELVPTVTEWARRESGPIPCQIVLANREYESWFIAGLEHLARDESRGLRPDAPSPVNPEALRDAKGYISDRMTGNRSYLPTADQPKFSAVFDMHVAHERCRSFRKLVSSTRLLLGAAGEAPVAWPAVAG